MPVLTYSPEDTICEIGGYIIGGFADGTFISVERETDAYTKVVGADGEVSRTRSANRSGRLTLTLKQTSSSNADLGAIMADDEEDDSGVVDVYIKDNLGYSLFAGEGWVAKPPTTERGAEESNSEWALDLATIEYAFPA